MRTARNHRRSFGALFLAATLVLAPASVSLADEHDEPGVECYLDDGDWALIAEPGDEITCEAWGLDPDVLFDWEVDYFDADTEEPLDSDGGSGLEVDEDGVGVFSFAVPTDLRIPAFYEVWVTQGEYEEGFSGVILVLADLDCAPDPVVAGNTVTCEVSGLAAGEPFGWAVDLTDDPSVFDEIELLEDEAFEDLEDLDDLTDLGEAYAEGEGEADADGVGTFSFAVDEDSDAVAYLAVAVTETGFGVYVGAIDAAPDDEDDPVSTPVEEQDDDADEDDADEAPVAVARPTRVDTGAGGASGAGTGPASPLALAALALFGLSGALLWQRRAGVR